MHNPSHMRRVLLFPVSVALLLAFLMAPFQHVHLASNDAEHADHDHDDTAIVHIHFYTASASGNQQWRSKS